MSCSSSSSRDSTCIAAKTFFQLPIRKGQGDPVYDRSIKCAMTLIAAAPDDMNILPLTMRGKAGQMSSLYLAGVLSTAIKSQIQATWGLKNKVLHRRHTWTSDCHSSTHLLSSLMGSHLHPHRNPIFVVGRHQEVRRFVSTGLHHLPSVE